MKEQMDLMIRLQAIEVEIRRLEAFLAEVPGRLAAIERQRNECEAAIEAESQTVDNLQQAYRNHESEVQDYQILIDKSEEKLRSVKTNKEYQATLKEIEDLRSKTSLLEDEMIDCLEQIDEAEERIRQKKADFAQISSRLDAKRSDTQKEADQARETLDGKQAEHQAVSAGIETGHMETFLYVKRLQDDHVAISSAVDAVCSGCHLNIPPQMYNELQRQDKMSFCPNCQRIIYWQKSQ